MVKEAVCVDVAVQGIAFSYAISKRVIKLFAGRKPLGLERMYSLIHANL